MLLRITNTHLYIFQVSTMYLNLSRPWIMSNTNFIVGDRCSNWWNLWKKFIMFNLLKVCYTTFKLLLKTKIQSKSVLKYPNMTFKILFFVIWIYTYLGHKSMLRCIQDWQYSFLVASDCFSLCIQLISYLFCSTEKCICGIEQSLLWSPNQTLSEILTCTSVMLASFLRKENALVHSI